MTRGSPVPAGGGCTAQGFAHPPTVIPSRAMKGILWNALENAHLFPCTSDPSYPYPLEENVGENLFTIKQKGQLHFFFFFFAILLGFFKLCLTDSAQISGWVKRLFCIIAIISNKMSELSLVTVRD